MKTVWQDQKQRWHVTWRLGHRNVNTATFTTRKLEIRVQNAVFKDSLKIEVNSREFTLLENNFEVHTQVIVTTTSLECEGVWTKGSAPSPCLHLPQNNYNLLLRVQVVFQRDGFVAWHMCNRLHSSIFIFFGLKQSKTIKFKEIFLYSQKYR